LKERRRGGNAREGGGQGRFDADDQAKHLG